MSGALKRLDDVREDMRRLQQELATEKQYFDSDEVGHKVRERVAELVKESGSGSGSSKPKP